jgi:tRNA threonylcarbamoyladenosine biosynthesis protein TsaE
MKAITLPLRYCLAQSEETLELGAKLAALCIQPCVLYLQGLLGTGKTTFTRGFIQQLGYGARVKSPTYTLVEAYTIGHRSILHFDLYRLQNPAELEAIGIRDYLVEPAIWLVEWPEHAADAQGKSLLPNPDIRLSFTALSDSHEVILTPHSHQGTGLLSRLQQETG